MTKQTFELATLKSHTECNYKYKVHTKLARMQTEEEEKEIPAGFRPCHWNADH
jgi:hypothetical protein